MRPEAESAPVGVAGPADRRSAGDAVRRRAGQHGVSERYLTSSSPWVSAFASSASPIWMLTGRSKHESQPDRSGLGQLRAHACRMPGVVPQSDHSDVEVIVVDNSSTDGTVEIAQAWLI